MARLRLLIRVLAAIVLAASFSRLSPARASTATWAIVSSPTINRDVNVLTGVTALSATNAWAAGYYRNSAAQYQTLIQHWNGAQWSVMPSPNVGTSWNFLYGVAAISGANVWAVGNYTNGSVTDPLVEHWNGTQWSVVASPAVSGDGLTGVAFSSATDGWAVGGGLGALTEHWDGTRWTVVSNPQGKTSGATLTAVADISASNVLAAGYIMNGYHSRTALIEHWDGSSWSAVATPPTVSGDAALSGVAADASGAWDVGAQQLGERTLAERWNGTSVSMQSTPDAGATNDFLSAVASVSPGDAWAVGQVYNSPRTLIEHWNGMTWSIASTPTTAGLSAALLGAAAVAGGTVWAVGGYYPTPGGQEQTLILRKE